MPCNPHRSSERVLKTKAPSATRRWLMLGADRKRSRELTVHVASGRAHWQKTAPSWGCFRVASAVCLGFLMGASGRARVQVFTGDRTFHSASLRCSWFSRALLGRSEPYEAYRKPRLLVVRFRSPRADPRGMNASRCAKRVSVPRRSDDASSLENGAIMGLATSASSERRGSLWTFANQTHSASLRACFMGAPFFASERVPRRRGHSVC